MSPTCSWHLQYSLIRTSEFTTHTYTVKCVGLTPTCVCTSLLHVQAKCHCEQLHSQQINEVHICHYNSNQLVARSPSSLLQPIICLYLWNWCSFNTDKFDSSGWSYPAWILVNFQSFPCTLKDKFIYLFFYSKQWQYSVVYRKPVIFPLQLFTCGEY